MAKTRHDVGAIVKVKLRRLSDFSLQGEINATPVTVDGYDGVLALHESKLTFEFEPETADPTDIWRVTEPVTGMYLAYGATRKQALAKAEAAIELERIKLGLEEDECPVSKAINVLRSKALKKFGVKLQLTR